MASSWNESAAEAKSSGKRKKSEHDSEAANLLVKRSKLKTKSTILKKHKKTLLVGRLPKDTGIGDIIDFFKDVGQVVRVQLVVNRGFRTSTRVAFVKFASSNQADKAMQKINNWHGPQKFCQIIAPCPPPGPKYCKDHIVWNKDYIIQEEEEEDETPPNVLFVSNLSPQTKLFHIIDYFSNVGEVVSVRLTVNPEGKHIGYGFVEFDSPQEAHKALELLNGAYLLDHMIFLHLAKLPPYRLRSKYNLAEKLCYEDYLRRYERLDEPLDETPSFVEAVAVRNKTVFVYNLSCPTEIQDIIDLFKDVGQVVHVRLLTDCEGNQIGQGYVEFASAKEAEKALKNKYLLHDEIIFLSSAEKFPDLGLPMYCIDHNVWYEEYLGRENRLIDEALMEEGFDETHDFAEEVALRKKTLFVYNLPPGIKSINIITYYKNVGQVCRVRLVVNRKGEHVGCCFVEFASAEEANKALLCKDGYLTILSDVVEMAPYPIRPKYNLAEKLWNEEYPESLPKEEDCLEKQDITKLFCGNKKIFPGDD